jgi:glutathione S-transferase
MNSPEQETTSVSIVMYDLADADGRRFSPNCWRTRMALAHKGLDCEARATLFTQIPGICGGGQKTVPVIEDAGRTVGDSWAIAEYLESAYPRRPSLFGGEAGRALSVFVQGWCMSTLHIGVADLIIADIHDRLDEIDKPYFRASREKIFARRLEDVQAGRESRVAAFRKSLHPIRHTLSRQRWIGGAAPLYADYLVFGALQWARIASDFTLLDPDDLAAQWFERMLDLHDGLGRRARAA